MTDPSSVTALWGAVTVSGLYHGINPGMGWPLAVSAALMSGKKIQLPIALGVLGLGHLLAMTAILLPFSFLTILIENQASVQLGASLIVILMGIYLLWNRRHPKYLARVHPARLALWSFLAAMAHGAGLMLVPMYLGINGKATAGASYAHAHANHTVVDNVASAISVAVVHTLAMLLAAAIIATVIYFWLGLKFLSKTWFNLDVVWALSLVVVGAVGIYNAI
ncbi:hypothetical protein N9850_07225 [Granulosicoccus sp.]|nr:hypothetical protein [Granulosicoccus sp.]MDB4223549.1 hypothetical protein [Granulosicoccus sp.]